MSAQDDREAARDVANEDFLFHLYRGSELLQDNRVLEAKTELEFALTLQPRDPKGQDLLAVVYFRIGHYPRAIQIYEELLRANPKDLALKLNLALCFLKTGQAQPARTELEDVVRANPAHKRAWGYLGLAYERLGDHDRAHLAFKRGGHDAMAKRMMERGARRSIPPPASLMPSAMQAEDLRAAAKIAFEELDAGELSFALAEPERGKADTGQWHANEPGRVAPISSADLAAQNNAPTSFPPAEEPAPADHPSAPRRRNTLNWGIGTEHAPEPKVGLGAPRSIADVTREAKLTFPEGGGLVLLANGLALAETRGAPSGQPAALDASGLAVRLEAIRSYAGELTTSVLQRRTRAPSTDETFGGVGTPIVSVTGNGQLVVGPRPSHRLVSFALRDEVAFAREDLVLAFEMTLGFENGRLAMGDGESASMVQLKGTGSVLLELREAFASLDVVGTRSLNVRREVIIGWVGRLVPRALPLGEAPCGQRGLVSFSGEGSVLITAK